MNIEDIWNKALKNTEIIRARVQALLTMGDTKVPYILLSESEINIGDTVVRKGEVVVAKPSLIVPPLNPQFKGFEFNTDNKVDENSLINFLIVRGVSFPSLRYDNKISSLEIFEGKLSEAVKNFNNILQKQENVVTGLVVCPDDCWQLSLLLFVCSQIVKNADVDIRKLLDEHKKRMGKNEND